MARTRGTKKKRRKTASRGGRRSTARKSARSASRSRANGRERGSEDAIKLLKNDHREVEQLFEQFSDTNSEDRQQSIAARICRALIVHTTIEEEIFYPAFLDATEETDIHHEAEIEHEGVKHLIEEIEAAGPSDDHFEARVSVLKEMVKHHVEEEERRGGMFAKAAQSDMDLDSLGDALRERKQELEAEAGADSSDEEESEESTRRPPPPRARRQSEARAKS